MFLVGMFIAYSRCKPPELRARRTQTTHLLLWMLKRFLKLGTPISSHRLEACALSTSSRVGATKICIEKLLAPRRRLDKMLMATCSFRLRSLAVSQLPRYIVSVSSQLARRYSTWNSAARSDVAYMINDVGGETHRCR